jgi:SNF2 family DNA or RNA helicase
VRTEADLRRPQKWAADLLYRQPAVILAWDMGAGKTAAVLTAIRRLLDADRVRKVLIVAPLLVAETTWPDEIDEWEHTALLRFSIVTGTEKKRIAALKAEADIYCVNKENVPWLWKHLRDGADWDFDMLVIDEASMLKSGVKRSVGSKEQQAERRKKREAAPLSRFGVLAQARKKVDHVVEMTGTPAPNGLHNLWGLAYIADLGERLGSSRSAFEDRWFTREAFTMKLIPTAAAHREIPERLQDIMFSLDPADYASLPEMVENRVVVDLPEKVMAEYRRFKRTLVSETYDVEAMNRGVLTNKLLQFANGSMYQEDGDDIAVHDLKLDALERIIEEAMGEPVLVAYGYKFDLSRIRKRYPKAIVLNEQDARSTVRRWNEGAIPLLLAHRASAGHGLNMQYGSGIMVQYGLTHDLELYQQFNKRLHRPGQTRTVFNHHIIARGTIDEDILPILADKAGVQDDVLRLTRAHISKET